MNSIKTLLIVSIIAILAILSSCNNESIKSNKAVIKLDFKVSDNIKPIIKSTSPFQLNADTLTADANGKFIFNIKIKSPAYYNISFEGFRQSFTIYIRPGDSVIVNAQDISSIANTLTFNGNAPVYNDYIYEAELISRQASQSLMNLFKYDETRAMFSIDSIRAIHADNIASLQKGNANIDPFFLKIEKARAIYEWAKLHKLYPLYFNYINKLDDENGVKLSPEYDTYLAEVNLNDDELITLPAYIDFLKIYLQADYNLYYNDDELETKYGSYANYQLYSYNEKVESKEIKSILSYSSIMDQVNYQGKKEKDTYWTLFESLCTNEILKSNINVELSKWAHLDKGQATEEIEMNDIEGNKVHFSDFKGKWIYIDIWATWCSPCVKEIPTLKNLEKQFHGQNIVFMSISVDKTAKPWLEMVKDKELKGIQVWAGQNETINTFYKVNGIPRFMIFDPQGNIYDANAIRPSMGMDKVIEELLKK